ncbi:MULTISPECIES: hypothetical protein [Enterobacteriaceae]|uniref:Lipoprotein n=1 Tax=Kluyvera genomosp. 2 TaxID=2774054 RepID=A0A2T2XVD5_9ENTR|nr:MULTISPECIES: hypothetical protein [Enterobacteriaceae]HAT3921028.1 hypothetical protein [Kluyvera ascorbata]PSR44245.1 hypothetical protein C8256_24255 [Kluyvera genomosp. 2]BBQ85143.1 hypothetical protein WP3W18E02_36720 [Klebsiella sp. WP3-W18-ESBL-02]BBR22196.1 hypothetical protein WP3S18E05_36760 [Klebsiella sp. WP3-S18-ESBL-05]BBR57643.1 hypothetical protein WP4W18E05_10110 [Klebsiella sp. WP4-W18-ESBL-05]
MIKYLLLVVVMLVGCTSAPNLPPTDTIVAVKPVDSGIIASSAKYSYRFFRTGFPQEYQRYKTFYERFHQQASGVRVNFVVDQHEVTAEYVVVVDKRKLDAGQHAELVNQYHAVQIDNDRLGILFKATGFWSSSYAPELAAEYRLEQPVVVSINDKTKTLSSLGEIAMIPLVPLFPLYMMYGCATGPCI